jgi:hypothetical protein
LLPEDRQKLRNRGLTDEQIKKGYFGSLPRNYPWVSPEVDREFPGIDKRGILGAKKGIICPAANADGYFVGFQIRTEDTDSKYRWTSSAKSGGYQMHLPNGEMPLAVAAPIDGSYRHEGIGLCEGILKPYIAAQRWGKPIVGAAVVTSDRAKRS